MQSLWLYLHFSRLQLNSLFSDAAHLPVVIVNGRNHDIMQACDQAMKSGITPGMGLATAALLCPKLQVHQYQSSIELQQLHSLAQWLYRLTSDICLYPPNGLLLRVHPMLNLYQGINNYWHVLSAQLNKLAVDYQFATANTPLAAKLLAKSRWNQVSDDPQQHSSALNKQPVTHCDITTKQQKTLHSLGIRTLENLFNLSLADIARRFDIELVNYVGRLKGELQHPHQFYLPPAKFKQHLPLLYEISQQASLLKPIDKLLNQLQVFLRERDKVCTQITLVLALREGCDIDFSLHSAEGEYRAQSWLNLVKLHLETLHIPSPVTDITLSVDKLYDTITSNTDLFAGKQGVLTPLQLVSTLQARLGQQALSSPMVKDDIRPDIACQYTQPLATPSPPQQLHKLRPLFLLPQPQPLDQHVSIFYGPERISSGWWDDTPVLRDYFIARNQQGQWHWVFRQADKRWFLHGYFS